MYYTEPFFCPLSWYVQHHHCDGPPTPLTPIWGSTQAPYGAWVGGKNSSSLLPPRPCVPQCKVCVVSIEEVNCAKVVEIFCNFSFFFILCTGKRHPRSEPLVATSSPWHQTIRDQSRLTCVPSATYMCCVCMVDTVQRFKCFGSKKFTYVAAN